MDLSGQRFGLLTVEYLVVPKPYSKKSYMCKCDCGNTCIRLESTFTRGKKSNIISNCGCLTYKNLTAGDSVRCTKAGLHRKDAFVNGCNIQMTLRPGTISSNVSGCQGVSWSKSANKWHVYIGYKNYRANLGFVSELSEAIWLRKQAEESLKNGTFEQFYFSVRGFHIEERNKQQYKRKR